MKIAIAINGEGKGHFSRCYALAEVLETAHDLVFFAPEHVCSELASRFPLCTVRMIPYFHFVQHGFSIDYPRTIAQNASLFLNAQPVIGDVARALVREGVDAVLSDFEPFTSRAANTLKIPVLQLNHPGIVMRTGEWSLHSLAARIVSRYMMEGADKTVLCSFFDGDVGPILRSELRNATVSRGDYFVVYQKDRYKEILKPVLQKAGYLTLLWAPGKNLNGVDVGMKIHIRFFYSDKSFNGGPVDHALVIKAFLQLARSDRHIL